MMKSWRRRTMTTAGGSGGWRVCLRQVLLFALSRRGVVAMAVLWCTFLMWAVWRQQQPTAHDFEALPLSLAMGSVPQHDAQRRAAGGDGRHPGPVNMHVWMVAVPAPSIGPAVADDAVVAQRRAASVVQGAHLLAEALSAPVQFPLAPVRATILCCCRGNSPLLPPAASSPIQCVESLVLNDVSMAQRLCSTTDGGGDAALVAIWRRVVRDFVAPAINASDPPSSSAVVNATQRDGDRFPPSPLHDRVQRERRTTRDPTIVIVADTILSDIGSSAAAASTDAQTGPADPQLHQRRAYPHDDLLGGVKGLIRQSITFGGMTTARWLAVAQEVGDHREPRPRHAPQDRGATFSILLDGLRVVLGPRRTVDVATTGSGGGGSVGREVAVEPRFHGYDAMYEAHAEGSYVSPLYARETYVAGSARDLRFRSGDDDAGIEMSSLRTIDLPDGMLWAAPLSMTLDGFDSLVDAMDNRRRQQGINNDDGQPALLSLLLAIHAMSACRRRSAQPSCTLFLSHGIHLQPIAAFTTGAHDRLLDTHLYLLAWVDALIEGAAERHWVSLGSAPPPRTSSSLSTRLRHSVANALYHDGDAATVPNQHHAADGNNAAAVEGLELLTSKTMLYWDPFCSCTGINVEAINFLVPLERELPVQAVASPDCWCNGFPPSDSTTLARIRQTSVKDRRNLPGGAADGYSIWVSHKPVDFFPTFPYRGAITFLGRPSYVIGRAMIESDRFSDAAVRIMNDDARVDELWVPSPFLVDVLHASGVKLSRRIAVVPEAIDAAFYNPYRFNNDEDGRLARTPLGGRERFRFLSNFKWEPRKGWDLLLEAYFTSFEASDPVELVLKTYLYMDPRPRDVHRIQQRVVDFVRVLFPPPPGDRTARTWAWVVEHLPKVTIVADEIPAHAMPAFYAAHDAFVLPTRGEGWGLPFLEAMSMGLPCIATAWSGMLGFMNHNNSYLVDVLGTEAAVDQGDAYDAHIAHRIRRQREQRRQPLESMAAHGQLWEHCVFDEAPSGTGADTPSGLSWLRRAAHGVVVDRHLAQSLQCNKTKGPLQKDADVGGTQRRTVGHWAVPNVSHAGALMRYVFDHPIEGRTVGMRGRIDVVRHYNREAVAGVVTKRLLGIVRMLQSERK